jgi:hypothetical protein
MRGIIRTGARQPVTGNRAFRAGDVTRSNAQRAGAVGRVGNAGPY